MIILIGGAFNPVTNAHIEIGKQLKQKYEQARIIYIPAYQSYLTDYKGYKADDVLSIDTRLSLLQKSLPEELEISYIDIAGIATYAIEHIEYFEQEDPSVYYVIGSDQLYNIQTWYRGDSLNRKRFILIPRVGYPVPPVVLPNVIKSDIHIAKNSSTQVRQLARAGEWKVLKLLVPEPVYKYYKIRIVR